MVIFSITISIFIILLLVLLFYPMPICFLLDKIKLYDFSYLIKLIYYNIRKIKLNEKKVIFSIDDCIDCLYDLYENDYGDIFESKYFKLFKDIHDKYNIDVNLFIMYKNDNFDLSLLSDKYKEQFMKMNWLKFGFHSLEISSNYDNQSILADYEFLKNNIIRIFGDKSLSSYLRVHGYKGSFNEIKEVCSRDNLSLILADDFRKCYQRRFKNQYRKDKINVDDINLISSSIRLERIRFNFIGKMFKNSHQVFDVFTHEKHLNDKNIVKLNKILK